MNIMQTKPLRSYGVDVTYNSLQPVLDSLGIDEQVKNLSQAEKEILRYIATLKQASISMGDFANNLESPSNQLKIFKQQLVETKVALSSLFIGTFANIMPYLNAFLMVIKEVSTAIATMFGIELTDYNTGIASQEGIYDGIADSVDNATDSVKELKRQTLGFDEIHNINENNNSGSSGTSVSGGIDQRLLDAITGYDNGMDKVKMKATEIRDKIMEWLGFTKVIDPLTGEVSFKYEGIKKFIKNIYESFKKMGPYTQAVYGWFSAMFGLSMYNNIKKIVSKLGSETGLAKVFSDLFSTLNGINFSEYGSTFEGISAGMDKWKDGLTIMDRIKITLLGTGGILVGLGLTKDAMKKVSDEGWNFSNSLEAGLGFLSSTVGGAIVGSQFGLWGTIIGGATGAVLDLVSALLEYENQGYKTADSIKETIEVTNEYSDSLLEQYDTIRETIEKENAVTTAHSNLIDELESIIDANGKVKKGYEERANFIVTTLNNAYGTELSIIDGKIQKYDDEINKIKDVITEKKKEIALESASQAYELAISEKAKTYSNLQTATENYNNALEEQERYERKLKDSYEKYKESYYKQYKTFEDFLYSMSKSEKGYENIISATEEAKDSMDKATIAYDANTTAIMQYQGLLSADAQENADLVDYYMNEIENTYYDGEKFIKLTYDQQIEDAQEYYNSVIRIATKNGQEITDEIKSQAESRLNAVIQDLQSQSTTVENITPQIAEAWATLGKQNKEKFLDNFKKLNPEIQQEIVDKMYEKGLSISEELQKGISQINPTIKIDANTNNAQSTINSFIEKLKQNKFFSVVGGILGAGLKSSGGVYSNGSWKNIPQYANGGIPSHGSMFVAGEAGAEIVGHINGRTEVLNQSQIASAIYSAVYSAMSQFSSQSSEIDVHVHTDEGIIVDKINQRTKQTGSCPINIPMY